jgi:hypothetical protein
MSRGNQRFKQTEVTRALRGVAAAGIRARIEISRNGALVITPIEDGRPAPSRNDDWEYAFDTPAAKVRPRL